jgi:hypothetical protein
MVVATSLPRWILGHYVIGAGARTAWWGRARPPEYKIMSQKNGQKCDKTRVYGQNKSLWAKQTIF